ncbi:MAG: alpha/beta hydrolase family esterase [Geminicoccaceae bacterium]
MLDGLTKRSLFLSCAIALAPATAMANGNCGLDEPCEVELGTYNIALPEDPAKGFVLYFHGAGGNGGAVVTNETFVDPFLERGYGVIAPTGITPPGPGARWGNNWALKDGREPWRDDFAFTAQVLDDAEQRFDVDLSKLLVTGYSRGGSFVWDLACHSDVEFVAFAPVAGAFWIPLPEQCASGPMNMLHTHGFVDTTVPLEGRWTSDERGQGDVFQGLQILRATNGCAGVRPDDFAMGDQFRCRIWAECTGDTELQLCLHNGGHGVPDGWADLALDWFERVTG